MESEQLQFVDTHCHLYADAFDEDRDEVVRNAIQEGVHKIMLPNIDRDSFQSMWNLVNKYPRLCFPMIGLHPCSVTSSFEQTLDGYYQEVLTGRYSGIGETGVDLYWDTSTRDIQVLAFEQQIKWALETDLPVIIHSRESLDLNIEIIQKHQNGHLRGIFHCFGGTAEQGMRIHELGFKIGIGGILTFKNSQLGSVLKELPAEMIVLETDAPYLAPVPYRGKRNEPGFIRVIAGSLALALGMELSEIALMTSANAEAIFTKKD